MKIESRSGLTKEQNDRLEQIAKYALYRDELNFKRRFEKQPKVFQESIKDTTIDADIRKEFSDKEEKNLQEIQNNKLFDPDIRKKLQSYHLKNLPNTTNFSIYLNKLRQKYEDKPYSTIVTRIRTNIATVTTKGRERYEVTGVSVATRLGIANIREALIYSAQGYFDSIKHLITDNQGRIYGEGKIRNPWTFSIHQERGGISRVRSKSGDSGLVAFRGYQFGTLLLDFARSKNPEKQINLILDKFSKAYNVLVKMNVTITWMQLYPEIERKKYFRKDGTSYIHQQVKYKIKSVRGLGNPSTPGQMKFSFGEDFTYDV